MDLIISYFEQNSGGNSASLISKNPGKQMSKDTRNDRYTNYKTLRVHRCISVVDSESSCWGKVVRLRSFQSSGRPTFEYPDSDIGEELLTRFKRTTDVCFLVD